MKIDKNANVQTDKLNGPCAQFLLFISDRIPEHRLKLIDSTLSLV